MSDKLLLGCGIGRAGWSALKSFIVMRLFCKKTNILNIKVHPVVDMIGCLLHGIIHYQKVLRTNSQSLTLSHIISYMVNF